MSTSTSLWLADEETGIVRPPSDSMSIRVPNNLYVNGKIYLKQNPSDTEAIDLNAKIDSLHAAMADFESGQELENHLANVNSTLETHNISALSELYTLGMMEQLSQEFQYEQYRNVVVALLALTYEHSAAYTENLDYSIRYISGMYKATIMHRAHAAEVRAKDQEIARLQSIIDQTAAPPALTTTTALGIIAEIPPEITIYLQRYGAPQGWVFDPQLLWEILAELEKNGGQSTSL
jgi:hypothetical protein